MIQWKTRHKSRDCVQIVPAAISMSAWMFCWGGKEKYLLSEKDALRIQDEYDAKVVESFESSQQKLKFITWRTFCLISEKEFYLHVRNLKHDDLVFLKEVWLDKTVHHEWNGKKYSTVKLKITKTQRW